MSTISTVTGPADPAGFGRILVHEHVLLGYPGWESDTLAKPLSRDEMLAVGTDRIAEMQAHGAGAMIDPCPSDLGRDVEFMAELSARTGFRIICATGLYKEDEGGAAYWKMRANLGAPPESMAEVFIHELEHGIGDTGIRPGILKVASGQGAISEYEKMVLGAVAIASNATGAPITTHTDHGMLGDEQQAILTGHGVPAERILIGHSCGSSDTGYHNKILSAGSWLGFDRFGLEAMQSDDERVRCLAELLRADPDARICVSHDSVWCWRGRPIPDPEALKALVPNWQPSHFFENIIPRLREAGVTEATIERLLVNNPRSYLGG